LRHTVTVADEKTAQYLKQLGIKGPWPASDKVMVCVGTDFSGHNLVRIARRIADRLQAKWTVVTVETSDDDERTLQAQQQLSHTLHVAEELGAEVVVIDGANVADTLVQYALTNNVTDMIVGQSPPAKPWQKIPLIGRLFGPETIADQILSHHPALTLRVIPTEANEPVAVPPVPRTSFFLPILPYFFSLMITLGMLFAAGEITKHTKITDPSTFFFLSILWVSIKFGLWPALLAAIVGSLVYDYNYIEPKYSLGITNLEGWIVLFSFIFAALVISNLAIHSRNVLSASQSRLRQIRFFSDFSNQLTRYTRKDQIMGHLCKELHRFLKISVIAFWDIHENLIPAFQFPKTKDVGLTEVDASAIQWALAHKNRSGRSTENFSDAAYLYLPIKIGNNSLGVVGIQALKDQLTIDDLHITQTLVDQAALAIDRLSLRDKQPTHKD
jgi:two-component system sensor histidine kinase KdpD